MSFTYRSLIAVISVSAISGCVAISPNSPVLAKQLKIVSAGHTGCLPDENELSNINANPDGNGTWMATCKGRAYLCSGVASVQGSESFSCAPFVP